MDEGKGITRRLDGRRRLLSNPSLLVGRALGSQSLPPATRTCCAASRRSGSTPNADSASWTTGLTPLGRALRFERRAVRRLHDLRPLGAGGMAEVYLALHPRLRGAIDQGPRRGDHRGSRVSRKVQSGGRSRRNAVAPHIVGVHDRGEFNGQLWISMDYVDGTDASRLVRSATRAACPIREVCAIVKPSPARLTSHDRGLLHRDVKPPTSCSPTQKRASANPVGGLRVARHLGDISGITRPMSPSVRLPTPRQSN